MKILFSCTGTSDPVRTSRDGPLLHIIRHYRPERVVVLLSAEEVKRNRKLGDWLHTMFAYINEQWGGYSPELKVIPTTIDNPSDMDAVSEPIKTAVRGLATDNPHDELLLNTSSGTPQMKTVLALLATDMRYRTKGVQVTTPEQAAGTAERTNRENYNVLHELECNKDEQPDAESRCSEPQLLYIQRQNAKEQIFALLEQRDYSAIYAMKNSMPDQLKALVGHLDARDRLQSEEAKSRAQNLSLPFSLYPAFSAGENSDYGEVSEAYLALLNRQHRRQYEELILRLNPLVVRLQLHFMQQGLKAQGVEPETIISKPYSPKPRFHADRLHCALPEVFDAASSAYGRELSGNDVTISMCQRILEQLPGVPEAELSVLKSCETLNKNCRNKLAHQLIAFSQEQFTDACGMDPAQLLRKLGEVIASLYKECDPKLFTIYLDCGEYIKENLI